MRQVKGVSAARVFKVAGAWVSFCIGAGFASGQDLLQYFCTFGLGGLAGLVVAMTIHGYCATSALVAGYENRFENPMDVFRYYCGSHLAKAMKVVSVFFMALSPTVGVAGFGASVSEYLGLPSFIGSATMGLFCMITVILGLRRVVDITGVLGAVIIVASLSLAGSFLIVNQGNVLEGALGASSMGILGMGPNWLTGGVFYASWAPLISLPFLVSVAKTVELKREAVAGGILGTAFYGLATLLMICAFWSDFAEVGTKLVPTLFIAAKMSSLLGMAFFAMVFLGVYTSAVPTFFTLSSTFFKEHTIKYNIFTVVVISSGVILTMLLPFNVLLNYVFSLFGYVGILIIALMIVKDVRTYVKNRSRQR